MLMQSTLIPVLSQQQRWQFSRDIFIYLTHQEEERKRESNKERREGRKEGKQTYTIFSQLLLQVQFWFLNGVIGGNILLK